MAIIDVSGSMAGGKLEAVKHALVQNINRITAKGPKSQMILIPFDTDVQLYVNPQNLFIFSDSPHFFKLTTLKAELLEKIVDIGLTRLEDSHQDWTNIVKKMRDQSMTALGPALYIGIETIIHYLILQNQKLGGKILLLTDGLANVGIGAVEQNHNPEGEDSIFYHRMAELCVHNNIIVDMIGVRDQNGGNSVALDIIGQITNYTGGKMMFITADQIETAFGNLQKTHYIARDVILRVFAPSFLELREIQGVHVLGNIADKIHGEPIKLGGFSLDREIYLKFNKSQE